MSRNLTVNNNVFPYPDPGDSPGWGPAASDWAEEVTNVLSTLLGSDDITETSFNISNNVTTFTDITGLQFNTGSVRSAVVTYSLYRTSSTTEEVESGEMFVAYKNTAASWTLSQNQNGNANVLFDITSAGQIQYKSSNYSGISYSGVMKFIAKSLHQS